MALSHSPRIVTDGLVLCLDAGDRKSYPGSGTTWKDRSGNGDDGTLYSGAVFDNDSIAFDGSDDLIGIPFVLDTSGSFTVEVWAKSDTMDNTSSNRQTIFSFNKTTNGYQLLDLEVWGNILVTFNGNNSSYTATWLNQSSDGLNANNWHCYVLSSNNGSWTWYLDGSSIYNTYTPTYTETSVNFKLASRGSGVSGYGQQLNGNVASSKIYNKALTADEVLQNFQATRGRFGI